jgi:predicted ATP-dependent Lon-type protease
VGIILSSSLKVFDIIRAIISGVLSCLTINKDMKKKQTKSVIEFSALLQHSLETYMKQIPRIQASF